MFKSKNIHIIYCIIILLLIAIIVRLATNKGNLFQEEYYKDKISSPTPVAQNNCNIDCRGRDPSQCTCPPNCVTCRFIK